MRSFDDCPDPSDAELALAVIDATLAGEAVDPEYAGLAELTLILAAQRAAPSAEFSAALDDRVARRFARPDRSPGPRRRRRWLYAPGVAGLAVAIVIVVGLVTGGPAILTQDLSAPTFSSSSSSSAAGSSPAISHGAAGSSAASSGSAGSSAAGSGAARSGAAKSIAAPASSPTPAAGGPGALASLTAGRQVVQSAQLSLSTRPGRVDQVARQVFGVVSGQNGVVESSTVTANGTSSGYAQFQLSVPSANLEATMSALSGLGGAAVVSRTDSSQDITGQVGGAGRRLADDRALRTALLRRLAAATTTIAIDSLQIQVRDAEAAINRDLAILGSLHRQVALTQIAVTINAQMAPGRPVSGGGLTIGRAAHDAGRVLVVAAGVALIALAGLVPLALVASLLAWMGLTIRRRRREQALDLS